MAYNSITDTVEALLTGSTVSAGGALALTAMSNPTINAWTLAGSITGATGQQGAIGFGGAGAVSDNIIQNTVTAQIGSDQNGAALTHVTTASGTGVSLTAGDGSAITANAGGVAVAVAAGQASSDGFAVGAAIALNSIGNSIAATIDNATVASGAGINLARAATRPSTWWRSVSAALWAMVSKGAWPCRARAPSPSTT